MKNASITSSSKQKIMILKVNMLHTGSRRLPDQSLLDFNGISPGRFGPKPKEVPISTHTLGRRSWRIRAGKNFIPRAMESREGTPDSEETVGGLERVRMAGR